MATDRDLLAEAQEQFDECEQAEAENRRDALDDLRFARLAEQWPDKIRRDRDSEGRPCLTINRLPAFVRQVTNECRQNKPSIRCRPASDDASQETAEIYDGLIRHIEQYSDAEVAYDTAVESAVSSGIGYYRIGVEYAHDDTFDMDVKIQRVANPFTVYGDPHSTAADASDWNRAFVTEMIPNAEFERRYKGADRSDWNGKESHEQQWFNEDATRIAEWWQREEVKRKIVLLSDGHVLDAGLYQENKAIFDAEGLSVQAEREAFGYRVTQRIVSGTEVLETTAWAGRYIPICPVYGDEVNIEGRRHFRSLIRDAKDPQRMFNFWRTSSTELVALAPKAPFIGRKGAFNSDRGRWQTANVKSHAFLEYDGQEMPQRQGFAGVPAGAIQEALNAADDMKAITGLYDASLGARSNETSGVAIRNRKIEGDTSTFHFIDNLSRGIRYGGRVLIDLIPAVYSRPRTLRILGEDGKARNVRVNEQHQQPNGTAAFYDLTRGKYDLVVEAGPGFTTKREEAAAFMTEMVRANPQVAPLVMDKLVKAMDVPEADALAARFAAMLPPAIQALERQGEDGTPDPGALAAQLAQAQQQIQQLGQQLQQAAQAADKERNRVAVEQEKVKVDADANEREAGLKVRELELEEQRIAIERTKVRADIAQQRRQAVTSSTLVGADGRPITLSADPPESMPLMDDEVQALAASIGQLGQGLAQIGQAQMAILAELSRQKRVVRGPDGRITGVQ